MKTNKICTHCGKDKPMSKYTQRKNLNATNTVYYKSMCKDCDTIRSYAWKAKNRERYLKYQRDYNLIRK